MTKHTATYSPEDNKLRLYPAYRLEKDEYNRLKAAGFKWAPKQELFVAPMWTPDREDVLLDFVDEIEDEDSTLVARAEAKAERLEDLSQRKAAEGAAAERAVERIADGIPLGQPILVGHHSERHARRDAERIESGMRRAVGCWEAASYWKDRAAGALRHAKYLERPDVRARRIKKLEAEQRKVQKTRDGAAKSLEFWSAPNLTLESAKLACGNSSEGYLQLPRKEGDKPDFPQRPNAYDVLGESRFPHLYAARTLEEVVEAAKQAYTAMLNNTARWLAHYANRLAYERGMQAESGGTAADKTGPEKCGACKCWASPGFGKGWSYIVKVNKVTVTVQDNWGNGGKNFTRTIAFDKLSAVMTAAQVQAARESGRLVETDDKTGFFLLDEPAKPAPVPQKDEAAERAEALRETLGNGVQVVSAPNLFPTPPEVVEKMLQWAGIEPGMEVLEPSAGTGAILDACLRVNGSGNVTAVEINQTLANRLADRYPPRVRVRCADFLECNGDLGKFDRVLMNPPFDHGSDIEHVRHARTFLKPGGRLVSVVANGPRQRAAFYEEAAVWINLPEGTFKQQGTAVNTAILVLEAE